MSKLEGGLNGVAKKVLDAVPIEEPWTRGSIYGELLRNGRTIEHRVIDGCLSKLKDIGLVREPSPGMWMRVKARPKLESVPTIKEPTPAAHAVKQETQVAEPTQEPKTKDAVDRLADLAESMRTLSKLAEETARQLDAVALEVVDQLDKASQDGARLRQLQALLKGL